MKRIVITPRWMLGILFFVILVCYSLFQARFVILGPYVRVDSPITGASTLSNVVHISGQAKNIAYISLNDRPIFIDEKGNWSEKLIAPRGLSIMTVRARDRFGRNTEKRVEIMVN